MNFDHNYAACELRDTGQCAPCHHYETGYTKGTHCRDDFGRRGAD